MLYAIHECVWRDHSGHIGTVQVERSFQVGSLPGSVGLLDSGSGCHELVEDSMARSA